MGFFSRRRKATLPPPPPPPAQTTPVAPPLPTPPVWLEPPPYHGYGPAQPAGLVPARYADESAHALHEDFMSEEDFNAIQNALRQDTITDQFSNIIASIDEDHWNENDDDFSIFIEEQGCAAGIPSQTTRAVVPTRNNQQPQRAGRRRQQKVTIWSKVSLYSNARLPDNLPPFRVYIPTWPLICLAAQYSANAYRSPQSTKEKAVFVSADARLGTKAMVIKSVPCDDKNTLVFAIRGTSVLSLRDWNVNLNTELVSPTGFLDDEGNLCHAGFLRVAKAMVRPIALRLRTLLEENPSRSNCSLLITGHSAGGAVASILFAHMLSSVRSELSILTECFKRVHCVTFGAPPVSLLPLSKPASQKYRKSLFFSFMNEGDPVVRAEKAYVRSLVDLLSSPLPNPPKARVPLAAKSSYSRLQNSISKLDLTLSKLDLTNPSGGYISNPLRPKPSHLTFSEPVPPRQAGHVSRIWPVPMATLSNAGRLVVMRVPQQISHSNPQKYGGSNLQRKTSNRWEKDNLSRVTAHTVTDEQLRCVIFGDPAMHAMEVYLRRIDMLALKAVTART